MVESFNRTFGFLLMAISLLWRVAPVQAAEINVDVNSPSVSIVINRPFEATVQSGQVSVIVETPNVISRPVSVEMERVNRLDVNGDKTADIKDLKELIQIYLGNESATPRILSAADVRPRRADPLRPYGDRVILGDDVNWAFRFLFGLETAP